MDLDEALALMREGLGRRFCPRLGPRFLDSVSAQRDSLRLRRQEKTAGSPQEISEDARVTVGPHGGVCEEEDE